MELKHYTQHLYDDLMGFWTQHGLPAVPREFLPPTGLVVYDGETLLCGGFLVKSDTAVAAIGSICANPAVDKATRSEALDLLLLKLSELAQQGGFTMVSVATNVPALQARYERLGFKPVDRNVVCYAGGLV